MSSQISTPVGIPAELNFTLPSSMVPSRKYELRVAPYGQSSFTAGNSIRIVLPKMQRTLMNTQTGYLTGTVTFANAGVVDTDTAYVAGSFYNAFSRQVIRAGSGYVLETIDQPGLLVNAIMSMVLNPSEKQALSCSFGFNSSSGFTNIGPKINTAAGITQNGLVFNFAIPLIGLLNSTKMFPSWNGDIEIELTLASTSDWLIKYSGVAALPTYTISSVEYVVECLELAPEAYNMIIAQNPQQVVIKTQSYSFGGSSLPAAQPGGTTVDIPFQIKVNSLKQLIWYANPGTAGEGKTGGVNPNLNNWQMIINGQSYPQRPVQVLNTSEAYMQNQKSFGSVYSNSHSGNATANEFLVASAANGNYKAFNANAALVDIRANKWYQCLDLESINSNKDSLYSGITTNGTTSTLRLNQTGTALANTGHSIFYWSCHDVLVVMDMVGGITSVIQ